MAFRNLDLDKSELLDKLTTLIARGTKPTVPEVQPLVKAYYSLPNNGAGGSLHCVLDDDNVHDDFVKDGIEYARSRGDVLGENLATVLLMMSRTQRLKVNR